MRKPVEVCVDAGLAVKTVVTEPDSNRAQKLFERWYRSGTQLISPSFFFVEVDSILCQKVRLHRSLTQSEADGAFAELRALRVTHRRARRQRERAWEIASNFKFPTVYDATYLALAELRGCEFWTADKRLYDKVHRDLSYVRWLGTVGG